MVTLLQISCAASPAELVFFSRFCPKLDAMSSLTVIQVLACHGCQSVKNNENKACCFFLRQKIAHLRCTRSEDLAVKPVVIA